LQKNKKRKKQPHQNTTGEVHKTREWKRGARMCGKRVSDCDRLM